jgi:hypothetical protein
MMIAKSWFNITANVAGRQNPSLHSNSVDRLSERSGESMPSRRDREVPYGMKGGERNGLEEGW